VSPRGYSRGPSYYDRGYIAPRSYGRPIYRGYYGGGAYLGYGLPYGYPYAPGYAYDPGYYYGPAAAPQTCAQGSYDQYGTWIPNPYCYSNQQQYPPPQQNYNPQQYPQQQPYYDPNQQQYPPQQQNYAPSQPQPYNR